MDSSFDLGANVHGGNVSEWLSTAKSWISDNAGFILGLLVVLAVMIIYFGWWRLCYCKVQAFMPTQTMWAQASDQTAVGNRYQRLYETATGAPPGSLSDRVLNSPDFNCAARSPPVDDAWMWQVDQTRGEGYRSIRDGMTNRPATSSDLSRILAGH